MPTAIRWLRSTFFSIPLILAGTVAAATLGLAVAVVRPDSSIADRIKRWWARWIMAVSFSPVMVEGREHLPSGGAALYCANHLSYLDPPALIVATNLPVRFLAKESLFRIPFLGWAMRREGDISIDRDNARAAAASLEPAAEALRGGMSLIAFPEGTRSPDGALQTFLSGAFRLVLRAQVPVIPVAIAGSRDALRPGSLFLRGGPIRVRFAAPILPGDTSRHGHEELSRRVQQEISRMVAEMSVVPDSARKN
jgi:1-acyl-sn-glycerol-3-phosphate acyltransferase